MRGRWKNVMHKLLLKKIRLEIGTGQSILHLSESQEAITEMLSSSNMLLKCSSLEDALSKISAKSKAFTYVIADLDLPALDDLDNFLGKTAPLIIRPGKLIILADNLCTGNNLSSFLFGNAPSNFKRPLRSVPPQYLKNKLIEHGYFVKNRFWRYDGRLLIMAETPVAAR